VQDGRAPTNTSALSGVMFSSLNLHPATLSGLHVSHSWFNTGGFMAEGEVLGFGVMAAGGFGGAVP